MFWYVACTKPNAECYAEDALTAPHRGCTVYAPKIAVMVSHAGRRVEAIRPFLPRYIFVRDDDCGVAHIRSAPGVSSLPPVAGGFMRVRQSVIDEISARENDRGLIDLDYVDRDPFQRGKAVVITSGPFQWRRAIFDRKLSGGQRAAVFISCLNQQVETVINISELEAA